MCDAEAPSSVHAAHFPESSFQGHFLHLYLLKFPSKIEILRWRMSSTVAKRTVLPVKLLFVSRLLYWSLWTRPKPVASAIVFSSCSNLFLCRSASNPHVSFWWIFVESFESCHTDQDSNNHRWFVTYIIARFRASGHQCCSEVSENGVLFSVQTWYRHVISLSTPIILSRFDIWVWISGLFFIWRMLLRSPHGVAPPLSISQ